jgi:hypothetical protein
MEFVIRNSQIATGGSQGPVQLAVFGSLGGALLAAGLAGAVALVWWVVGLLGVPIGSPRLLPLLILGGVVLALVMLVMGSVVVDQVRLDRARVEAAKALDGGMGDPNAPPLGMDPDAWRVAVNERRALWLTNESDYVQRAAAACARHLQPIPRNGRRALNRIRLLVAVASNRGLLDDPDPIPPGALGKWVALQDRWPLLARAAMRDPKLLGTLEEAGERAPLEAYAADPSERAALLRLLQDASRFGAAPDRLVHLSREDPAEA